MMRRVGRALLNEQLSRSPIFTTAEAARLAGVSNQEASRSLSKLADEGGVQRVRRGLWALTGHPDFSPFAVVPYLLSSVDEAYVSLLSALNLHGMIEQLPRRIQVISTARRGDLETPFGTFEFHRIAAALFGGFGPYGTLRQFDIATPEKALFDSLYLSVQKGKRFAHLPELTLPGSFSSDALGAWIGRIENVLLRQAVERRWEDLADRTKD
jgi:predicted transcriptional regulator of viral defense system